MIPTVVEIAVTLRSERRSNNPQNANYCILPYRNESSGRVFFPPTHRKLRLDRESSIIGLSTRVTLLRGGRFKHGQPCSNASATGYIVCLGNCAKCLSHSSSFVESPEVFIGYRRSGSLSHRLSLGLNGELCDPSINAWKNTKNN